jgi:hypothetical protein
MAGLDRKILRGLPRPAVRMEWMETLGEYAAGILRRARYFPLSRRLAFYDNMLVLRQRGAQTDTILRDHLSVSTTLKLPAREVYQSMLVSLSAGKGVALGAAPYVSSAEVALLGVADRTASAEPYDALKKLLKGASDMTKAVLTACAYPVFLLIMCYFLVMLFSTKVIPGMKLAIHSEVLPGRSQIYMAFTTFVADWKWAMIAATIAGIAAFAAALPFWTGALRQNLDRWFPPFVVYRLYQAAMFLLGLAALVQARVPVDVALRFLSDRATPHLRSYIQPIETIYVTGKNSIDAFHTALFPPDIIVRIASLSRAGHIDDALIGVGEGVIDFTVGAVKAAASALFVMSLFSVAGFVAWTYDFMNTIGNAAADVQNIAAPH